MLEWSSAFERDSNIKEIFNLHKSRSTFKRIVCVIHKMKMGERGGENIFSVAMRLMTMPTTSMSMSTTSMQTTTVANVQRQCKITKPKLLENFRLRLRLDTNKPTNAIATDGIGFDIYYMRWNSVEKYHEIGGLYCDPIKLKAKSVWWWRCQSCLELVLCCCSCYCCAVWSTYEIKNDFLHLHWHFAKQHSHMGNHCQIIVTYYMRPISLRLSCV